MAMSYFNAFDLPLVIARPFNTYGPRQSARAIIPTIISQIASGMEEVKIGDLTPTRDLNFVKDTCNGFLALANADEAIGQTVNIGSNFEITMGDLFNKIAGIMNSKAIPVEDKMRIRPTKSEVTRLWCDNTKIKNLTGFEPQYSLDKGLEETTEWFLNKENLSKYKANIYNV
jgi:nucleoside-diphosphate-sugar epimerase